MQKMVNKMIGAEIITFNPDLELLNKNIISVSKQVNHVYVVDNNSANLNMIKELVNNFENVDLICLNENKGIAFAQNIGMKRLFNDQYRWGLTLDQDSVIPDNTISYFIKTKQFSKDNVGILALSFGDTEINYFRNNEINMHKTERVIASGNLVNLKAWNKVGGFDNFLFIDYVDFDFDAKLIESGYEIWETNDLQMKHRIGGEIQSKFFAKLLHLSRLQDHSEFREYYIMRNQIIFAKRYPKLNGRPYYLQVLSAIVQMRQVFVLSGNKKSIFIKMLMGIIDGIKHKD